MKTQLIVLLLLAAGSTMAQRGNEDRREPPTGADFVARLDKDSDGKVSESEFDGPAEHFSQFDQNGDGYIAEDEAPVGPPPKHKGEQKKPRTERGSSESGDRDEKPDDDGGGFVERFDQDGDGQVSEEEFDGPSEHFSHMDRNSDGYISADEAPTGPPPADGPRERQ